MEIGYVNFEGALQNLKYDLEDVIYQYTSSYGFLGILNKEGLRFWFTRFDCVNDTSEGAKIIECYKKTCSELLCANEIDDEYYNLIKDVKPNSKKLFYFQTEKRNRGIDCEFDSYICCFSLDPDSLPMWNYYVKDGNYQGYNLGIKSDLFNEYLNDSNRGFEFNLIKVVYKEKDQKEIIKKFLTRLFREKNNPSMSDSFHTFYISYNLLEWQLGFKSECFEHEKEVRAILSVPKTIPKEAIGVKNFSTEFREKDGYVIPYIIIPFQQKENLSRITIGPLTEKEISQSTVTSLLEQREYKVNSENIINSEIPIRF